MDADAALVPLEERSIDFYGDALVAVLVEVNDRSQVYVPVRPLCAYLGLAWSGQYERIKRDPILAEALRSVRVTRTEGGERGVVCLPLEYLPGWLFGISGSRVRPELQEKILRYRRECFRVLWEAFQDEAMVADGAARGSGRGGGTLVQIRDLGLAIARMAEQQMQLEQRVVAVDTRMDRAAAVVGDLRRRLGAVERRLEPGAPITDAQAAEVSARVKALAELLTGEDRAKSASATAPAASVASRATSSPTRTPRCAHTSSAPCPNAASIPSRATTLASAGVSAPPPSPHAASSGALIARQAAQWYTGRRTVASPTSPCSQRARTPGAPPPAPSPRSSPDPPPPTLPDGWPPPPRAPPPDPSPAVYDPPVPSRGTHRFRTMARARAEGTPLPSSPDPASTIPRCAQRILAPASPNRTCAVDQSAGSRHTGHTDRSVGEGIFRG